MNLLVPFKIFSPEYFNLTLALSIIKKTKPVEGGCFVHVKTWRPPKVSLLHAWKQQACHLAMGLGTSLIPFPPQAQAMLLFMKSVWEGKTNVMYPMELVETCHQKSSPQGVLFQFCTQAESRQRQHVKWASDHWQQKTVSPLLLLIFLLTPLIV